MTAYYNDNDPWAAAWLRELIADGLLPAGQVDERDIRDVSPSELERYEQVHLFAGIGGWPLALRIAEWPPEQAVWTGSCPCQPFSLAGKRKGRADKRHLWPAFRRLVAECRPPVVFGEQVAGPLGREWLAGVRADLEALGYAVGAADLPAACVGAPQIRQRLWWYARRLVSARSGELAKRTQQPAREELTPTARSGRLGGMVDGSGLRFQRHQRIDPSDGAPEAPRRLCESTRGSSCGLSAPWSRFRVILCADGKHRRIPVEPAFFPLAHGLPGRVGLISGAGNAIVPQVAAAFIRACAEAVIP